MNIRIFWVRAMKCMCAQYRLDLGLYSHPKVFMGIEFEPMLTPREKSPLPENFPRGGSNPRHCGQRAQSLPTSYSGPQIFSMVSKAKSVVCPQCLNRSPKLPVGIRRTGPCLASQSIEGCGWGFECLCRMDIHLNGTFSVCWGGRGVDNVRFSVWRLYSYV